MSEEILSVAVWEPVPGMEAASVATIRELIAILASKGYSRDILYRDPEAHYILMRCWNSQESRRAAQEDPDVQRCWARLGNEIQIVKVYEKVETVPLSDGSPEKVG
jgi:hypothetical protein